MIRACESLLIDHRGKRGSDTRHSKSSRNSRLHTISEKSEDIDRNHKEDRKQENNNRRKRDSEFRKEHGKERPNDNTGRDGKRSGKEKSRRRPERTHTFNRDPTTSQEIPFEYTYRV